MISRAGARALRPDAPRRLPALQASRWRDTEARILAAPAIRADFVQMLLTIQAGGGAHQPSDDRTQTFLYVLSGGADCTIDEHRVTLGPGGFAYVPHATDYQVRVPVATSMLLVRKRYDPVSGVAKPEPLTGNQANVEAEPFLGNPHARLQTLLPDDFSYDFAMNIFTFDAGHGLPFVETHVMEHGLYFLEGEGTYYLGEESYPVRADDFIWMGPYCPAGLHRHRQRPGTVPVLQKRQSRRVARAANPLTLCELSRPARGLLFRAAKRTIMEKIYRDADVDLSLLKGKTVAVIGYGIQGKAQAANAKDSGCSIIIGCRDKTDGSGSRQQAVADGFEACSVADAVKKADVLLIELADPVQPAVYKKEIAPHLRPGMTLCFCHGFSVLYGQIQPPSDVNVVLMCLTRPARLSVQNLRRAKAFTAVSAWIRMRRATRSRSCWPFPKRSAVRGPALWK